MPKNYQFKILDAWRPLEEQKRYYNQKFKKFKRLHPEWPNSRLKREVNKWVFPPDAGVIPWHSTGGAIDLTICYKSGRSLPMQSSKAKFPPQILKNRQLLKHILEKVGFTNYQFEPWHWSYGDSGWALRADRKTAIYGKIKPSSNFDNIKKMC